MSTPPRLASECYRGFGRYFLTICTEARREWFASADCVDRVLIELLRTLAAYRFDGIAYCFMRDHFHGLFESTAPDCDFRRVASMFKQRTAFAQKRNRKKTLAPRVLRSCAATGGGDTGCGRVHPGQPGAGGTVPRFPRLPVRRVDALFRGRPARSDRGAVTRWREFGGEMATLKGSPYISTTTALHRHHGNVGRPFQGRRVATQVGRPFQGRQDEADSRSQRDTKVLFHRITNSESRIPNPDSATLKGSPSICRPSSYARARFFAGAILVTGAAVFLCALIVSRLLRSASMRFTTLGGASTSGATISRPSILASIISRRPT
jgi:REP element-mobilizing transposase RayT